MEKLKSNLIKNKKSIDLNANIDSQVSVDDTIMVNINKIRSDKKLQKKVRNLFKSGTKVFIYGGLTTKEYTEIVDIDKLQEKTLINGKEEFVNIGYVKNSEKETFDSQYDIIGYKLNDSTGVNIHNIINYDDEGNEVEISDDLYMQTIFEQFCNDNDQQTRGIVQSSPKKSTSVYAHGGYLEGTIYGQYILTKDNTESDPNFDYFIVENLGQVKNGDHTNNLMNYWVDIDIPYMNQDDLINWGPRDQTGSTIGIEISWPWGISLSFQSNTGRIVVDDISDRSLDYARWNVSPAFPNPNINNITFDPIASWMSSGTLACANIRQKAHFACNSGTYDGQLNLYISYDY